MSHSAQEEQLAALREEIKGIGSCYEGTARRLGGVCILGLILAVVAVFVHPESATAAVAFVLVVALATGVGTLLCCLCALASRGPRRRAILRELERLPPDLKAAVLVSLGAEPTGDTRQLVEPLLRDLNLPTELTPAGTPEGSGAEVSSSAR